MAMAASLHGARRDRQVHTDRYVAGGSLLQLENPRLFGERNLL